MSYPGNNIGVATRYLGHDLSSAQFAMLVQYSKQERGFWELEDASVDIGSLTAGAEDLGRLLLREFALICGNDWFQVPWLSRCSDVSIDSLVVADALPEIESFVRQRRLNHVLLDERGFCEPTAYAPRPNYGAAKNRDILARTSRRSRDFRTGL